MKTLRIQIQVILLTICIAAAVAVSGYLAYQSLSEIVDTIHKEARPDLKLLLIKDISADLSEVENTIRLYSLTGNSSFARSYRQLGDSIQKKLKTLSEYSIPGSEEISHIDSISLLANRKLIVWDKIRALHRSKTDAHNSFSNLYSKIDTVIIQPDTIRFKAEPKKGFFKRLFGKRDTTTKQPVVIDKSKEKEIIKKEIAGIEEQISTQTKQLQSRETALFEQNIRLTQELNRLIASLETSEQKHLENKTREVDQMAEKTYRGMAAFSIVAVIFLILILILIFRNLQKNRKYQQVLKKAKAEAESLAKAKEMFVATVSHEMRTPINAIYGLTSQMLRKIGPAEMASDLGVVHKSAEHLIALVNDTLDFSKIESQKLKIEQIDFLPDEILNEIQILHKESAQKKGITLIINNKIDKNLVLKGDPIRLKQILINLITNAIKFTQLGQVTLTLSGEDISPQTYKLHIEVADTGIGISKEDLNLIFDEFVQVGSDLTQKQRGAGLGLSIVKKLVLLQDGEINVESTPGKGTRFILQIPYHPGNSENISRIQPEQQQAPAWFANLHFLIVDDEEFNLYLIKNILNNWGVEYTEAHNGQEAVTLAGQEVFDLILMDIRMPVMNGFEAAQQILQQNSSARIIALTATTKPEDTQMIGQAGMHAFLPKPFPEGDLINLILQYIPEKMSKPVTKINEDDLIDIKELERIAGGDKAFLSEMLRIFIRSSEEALVKFSENIQNSNRVVLAEIAHKLAAPSKHMHATSLYNHLKKLENSVESLTPGEIDELIKIIKSEINQINLLLKHKLESS
jgi:signal transduction histidine kinase/CheY-like chemotaxis protein/HPt (histidine-containing phosphotransfer) domain-containing protein